MKLVIFAGGLGTRLKEETVIKPKPMVEIGERPILWHIMKYYSCFGIKEFIICLGYKGEVIKRFFLDYEALINDFTIDLKNKSTTLLKPSSEDWKVTLVDTGLPTGTAGRLKKIKEIIGNETFCLTYGDGLCNADIKELISFHKEHGKAGTVTAVRHPSRFGELTVRSDDSILFSEKPKNSEGWINGGFFVFEPKIFDYIGENDLEMFEQAPLKNLSSDGELRAFFHDSFWQCMDTRREMDHLNKLWSSGKAPWKVW